MWHPRSRWSPHQRILSIVCTVLAAIAPNLATAQNPAPPSYSGEDLFRGLFLGQGRVADLFPEIWTDVNAYRANIVPAEKAAEVEAEIALYVDGLLERIALAAPADYFADFAAEIQSGDHLRIEEAVLDGAERLIDAIAVDIGVEADQLEPFDPTLIPVIAVVVVAAAVATITLVVLAMQLAAALWAVGVVAVFQFVAAVNTRIGVNQGADFTPGYSTLGQDVWVDWIATRLAI